MQCGACACACGHSAFRGHICRDTVLYLRVFRRAACHTPAVPCAPSVLCGVRIRFVSVLSAEKFLYAGTAFFFPVLRPVSAAVGCGQEKRRDFFTEIFCMSGNCCTFASANGDGIEGMGSGCMERRLCRKNAVLPRGGERERRKADWRGETRRGAKEEAEARMI